MLFQKLDLGTDLYLLVFREGIPPGFELIGELDIPRHDLHYSLYGIFRQRNFS
jgi:hypothetical protein